MLLVVSCGKDDLAEDAVMLQFSANDADWLLTRGADYTGDTGANPLSDMLVYGYYTGDDAWLSTTRNPAFPLFMDPTVVTNTLGSWSYSPSRYFFPTGKHSFFAFAPYQSVADDSRNSFYFPDGSETPALRYYIPDETADQKDLLLGWSVDVVNQATPVEIQFRHITTKITFKACLAVDNTVPANTVVKIRSITISDIYSNAEATILYDQEIQDVLWQGHAGPEDIYISTADHSLEDIALTNSMQSITPANNILYLIPQNIGGRDEGVGIPVVTLAIEEYNTVTNTWATYVQEVDLSLFSSTWDAGQQIEFQITYQGSGTPVTLLLVDPGTGDPSDLSPIE